jgi:polyhydroxybutyrate depolymerase
VTTVIGLTPPSLDVSGQGTRGGPTSARIYPESVTRLRSGCAFVAMTLALTACVTSRRDAEAPARPQTPSQPSAVPSAAGGCAPVRAHPAGLSYASVPVPGARTRRYILTVPRGYDGASPLPLVVNLHGYGANADEQLFYSGLGPLADREMFVLATIDGQGSPRHYNIRPVPRGEDVSDITVVGRVVEAISTKLCIDSRRIFATGMSDGGALAAALACFDSERFAAVAPVAALFYDQTCDPAEPVPLIAFRGTDDEIVPYAGGEVACCGHPQVRATERDIADWAEHNGCSPKPTVTTSGEVRTSAYSSCTAGADVVLHAIVGGGHSWPGAIQLPGLGRTSRDIDASEAMWQFFVAHPKAER